MDFQRGQECGVRQIEFATDGTEYYWRLLRNEHVDTSSGASGPGPAMVPLISLWNVLGVVGGILGLASLHESLVDWRAFIREIIDIYQSIVYPVVHGMTGWLGWRAPDRLIDYLVIGTVVMGSYLRTRRLLRLNPDTRSLVRSAFIALFAWPAVVAFASLALGKRNRVRDHLALKAFFGWLATVFLGFVVLIIVNRAVG